MWDIIFAPIPGAFETPYQGAPLDLVDDTFYFSRKEMIEARLADISAGKAPEIIMKTDTAFRETKTWCVGVNWDRFERRELLEIVNVSVLTSISLSRTGYIMRPNILRFSALMGRPLPLSASSSVKTMRSVVQACPISCSGTLRSRARASLSRLRVPTMYSASTRKSVAFLPHIHQTVADYTFG